MIIRLWRLFVAYLRGEKVGRSIGSLVERKEVGGIISHFLRLWGTWPSFWVSLSARRAESRTSSRSMGAD